MGNKYMQKLTKVKKKYNAVSIPVKASLWFVACNCLQKATQIITTPIYTRILNTNQYGEYTVFLSWVELVAILATLDIFYSGFNVGMERFKTDRKNYASAMHGLCMALTTISVLVGFVFANPLSRVMGISPTHIKLLVGYMYVYPIYLFWSAQKKYDYDYKPLLLVTLLISVFTIAAGSASALIVDDKSTAVIVAKIVVEAIITIPLLIISVNGIRSLYNKYYWKYALKFNIPLIPHYLSTMILNHSDRIMILNMCGSADAAIYSVAYSIAMLISIIQNAVNSAITPWLYERLSSKNYEGIKGIITVVIGTMALLNLMLIMIAPEVVQILSTKSYFQAIWIIPPVSFGVFLTCIYGLFVNVELYYENNKLAAIASFISAIINLGLNYYFINLCGYIAAGYTTFASYLLLTIVHYFGAKKVCKFKQVRIDCIFDIRKIITIVFLFAITTTILMFIYEYIVVRYLVIFSVLAVALVERKRIINAFKMIKDNNGIWNA